MAIHIPPAPPRRAKAIRVFSGILLSPFLAFFLSAAVATIEIKLMMKRYPAKGYSK